MMLTGLCAMVVLSSACSVVNDSAESPEQSPDATSFAATPSGTPTPGDAAPGDDSSQTEESWSAAMANVPQVPGEVAYDFRLPVIDDSETEPSWSTYTFGAESAVSSSMIDGAAALVRQPLPAGYDKSSCPTLEQIVGPTTRKDERGQLQDRFLYAGQVTYVQLWHEYPETLYDVTVIEPYAGTPTFSRWMQYLRAHGNPLGLSGQPSGHGFALEPGKILLISQTAQNSPSANAYPDQLPYELVDGWWEPMNPATVRNAPLEAQLERFPVGCLAAPQA